MFNQNTCLEELAVSGCLGWPEFSSSIFNALFNQIQEVHSKRKSGNALKCYGHDLHQALSPEAASLLVVLSTIKPNGMKPRTIRPRCENIS